MSVTSVTTNNSYNWIGKNDPVTTTSSNKNDFIIVEGNGGGGNDLASLSDNVDDGLTSLSWLQNLNMCMTRLGAPTPPTPPASPVCFNFNQTICNVRRQPEGECGQTLANHHDHRKKQQQLQQQPSFSSKTKTVNNHNHHDHHCNDMAIIASESSSKNHIIFTHDCNQHNDNKRFLEKVDPTTFQRTTTAKTTTTENNVQNPKSDRSKSNGNGNSIDGGSSNKKSTNRRSICSKSTNCHQNNNNGKKNDQPNSNSVTDNNGHPMQTTQNSHHQQQQKPQPEESVDYKLNGNIKPPFSYATLICMAMKANKNKMTLSAIYKWIKENFLYYRNADPSWQNSIRHNLSLNKCFIKIARNKDEPGKGGFWKLDPIYADSLIDGIFKKRRPNNSANNNGNNKSHQRIENKDEDGCGVGGSIKKKPRKKRATTTARTIASIGNSNHNEFYISYIETNENDNNTGHQQETPPSSAESCAYKEHKMIDINELNNAINNIDNHCTYTYAFPSGNLVDCGGSGNDGVADPNLHGFSNEVCIDQSNDCIIETDGNDICWNAILTDVDLSQLVDPIHYTDSVAQIINPIENNESSLANHHRYHQETNSNDNKKSNAVQSNELEVTMDSNASTLLDDPQLFFHNDNGRIHSLAAFNTQSNNQVISATSNVVTCINDANMADNWNQHWSTYTTTIDGSMQIECSNVNGNELILGHMDQNSREVNMNEINILTTDDQNNIAFVAAMPTSSTATNNNDEQSGEHQHQHSTLTLNDPTMAQRQTTNNNDIVLVNDSQSPTNFDANHSMQVWDCKTPTTSMDTSGLELDNFNSLDQLHQF